MRQRHTLLCSVLSLLSVLVLLRHHLRDLSDVARTYATFYSYLAHHPGTLHRIAGLEHERDPGQEEIRLAPQIIHQIFLTEGRNASLSKYEPAIDSCKALHPDWTHYLWQDENAAIFVAQYYPALYPHYKGYKQSIQRANTLRYALLDHFGGVYLDLDITCLRQLDDLRDVPFLTPGAYPAGVNNAFILSRPHHRFLQHLVGGLASRDLLWGLPYVENMLSTGCMFFSNRWMSYVRSLPPNPAGDDQVFILADQTGDIEPHMLRGVITTPLFKHGGASSWHGWDATAIIMVGKHYRLLLALLAFGPVVVGLALWRCARIKRWITRKWHARVRGGKDGTKDEEALEGSIGRKA